MEDFCSIDEFFSVFPKSIKWKINILKQLILLCKRKGHIFSKAKDMEMTTFEHLYAINVFIIRIGWCPISIGSRTCLTVVKVYFDWIRILFLGHKHPNKMPDSAENDRVYSIEYLFLISNKTSNEMPFDCKQEDICACCQYIQKSKRSEKAKKLLCECLFVCVCCFPLSQNNNYDNASTNHIT